MQMQSFRYGVYAPYQIREQKFADSQRMPASRFLMTLQLQFGSKAVFLIASGFLSLREPNFADLLSDQRFQWDGSLRRCWTGQSSFDRSNWRGFSTP
jgi:hypothetical protein